VTDSRAVITIDFSAEAAQRFLSAVMAASLTDNLHGETGAVLASIAARLNGERSGPIVIERFRG